MRVRACAVRAGVVLELFGMDEVREGGEVETSAGLHFREKWV